MLTGHPIGALPLGSAEMPAAVPVPVFVELQDQPVIDVVFLVILTPFTNEDPNL